MQIKAAMELAKFKFIRQLKKKRNNGQRGMIIHRRAAIFERIQSVKLKTLQTEFLSFVSGNLVVLHVCSNTIVVMSYTIAHVRFRNVKHTFCVTILHINCAT